MARIDRPVGYRVDIMDYDRSRDPKVREVIYFDTEDGAVEYCEDFNDKDYGQWPNWYMTAEYRGQVYEEVKNCIE